MQCLAILSVRFIDIRVRSVLEHHFKVFQDHLRIDIGISKFAYELLFRSHIGGHSCTTLLHGRGAEPTDCQPVGIALPAKHCTFKVQYHMVVTFKLIRFRFAEDDADAAASVSLLNIRSPVIQADIHDIELDIRIQLHIGACAVAHHDSGHFHRPQYGRIAGSADVPKPCQAVREGGLEHCQEHQDHCHSSHFPIYFLNSV